MEKCTVCNKYSGIYTIVNGKHVCMDCHQKMQDEEILKRSESIKEPRDLKDWTGADMSELFWLTFVEYQKNPTLKGIELINRIFLWSCHANHTLSSTIYRTFEWCKMDLFDERRKMRKKEVKG